MPKFEKKAASAMIYTLTDHARERIAERKIREEWIQIALTVPDRVESDPIDPSLQHRLAVISENENRVLRVIVNTTVDPLRIVTVHFVRNLKGKL